MRVRQTCAAASAILWIVLSPAASGESVAEAQDFQRVDQLFSECDRPGSPGAAVAITHHGQVVYLQHHGVADLEHGIPVARETRFELASVSKQFTALAVFLLESEGRLSLNDPIRAFLPELPEYADAIEIHHLIHHTSGLPEYLTVARLAGFGEMDVIAFGDLLAMLQRWEGLYFPPGSGWRYTNTNYALLAEIVARVTGEPFADWMTENVFGPLQMHDTFIRSSALQVIPARAEGYRERDGAFVMGREALGDFPGAAHVYSTIDDIRALLPEDELLRLTDDEGLGSVDTARVDEAIARADADIDSYCGGRYSVPVSPVPQLLKKISVDLAVYDLYSRAVISMPEARGRRHRDALRQLEGIAKGLATLGTSETPEQAESRSGAETNKPADTNVFSRDKLGVMGFDMGGMVGLILAMRNAGVDAFASVPAGILFPHPSGLPASSPDYDPLALQVPWLHAARPNARSIKSTRR